MPRLRRSRSNRTQLPGVHTLDFTHILARRFQNFLYFRTRTQSAGRYSYSYSIIPGFFEYEYEYRFTEYEYETESKMWVMSRMPIPGRRLRGIVSRGATTFASDDEFDFLHPAVRDVAVRKMTSEVAA
jgi:hypothetical protein